MAQNGSIELMTAPARSPEKEKDECKVVRLPDIRDPISEITTPKNNEGTSVKLQQLTNYILQFLSNATNETLGACFIGLGAVTYWLLGRFGLILIGVVGGVVLHASWEENNQNQLDEESREPEAKKTKERGLDVIERILKWRGQGRNGSFESEYTHGQEPILSPSSELDFTDFQPATAAALTNLTDAVIRDHVKWWYSPLLPLDFSFPLSCRQTFTRFLLAISSHLSRKRPADVFLDFLTNSSSIVIVFLSELSAALMSTGLPNTDPSSVIYKYLEANPDCNLANVLDIEQQTKKFQAVAEDILQTFLEPKAYAFDPAKVFLREVLAGLILEVTLQRCSKPEWINNWIIYLLEDGEPEILNAIDAGVGGAQSSANKEVSTTHTNSSTRLSELSESLSERENKLEHKRTLSRAESAMEEAMQEARRLSELIAAEEAKRRQSQDESADSETTTLGQMTPTSSQSDLGGTTDGSPAKSDDGDGVATQPVTSTISEPQPSFTSFDQIVRPNRSSKLQSDASGLRYSVPVMTLYKANVSIFDDAPPGEKSSARAKPSAEYLVQIEPVSSHHPGWMISRKYADFENLHEVLRRISVVSGVPKFAQNHGNLPSWKTLTKSSLRSGLENYLKDALSYERLAESEGMKRFLEKDQGVGRSSPAPTKGGFSFPSPAAFETMGKGMLALASAPKGAAGGGKAILGGVSGVLGGVGSLGQKKQAQTPSSNISKVDDFSSSPAIIRKSQDSSRSSLSSPVDSPPPLPSRPSLNIQPRDENLNPLKEIITESPLEHFRSQSGIPVKPLSQHQPKQEEEIKLHLPPPPSEIPDDYKISQSSPTTPSSTIEPPSAPFFTASNPPTSDQSSTHKSISSSRPSEFSKAPSKREKPPLSEKETQVAVELFFAVINELYTLSSAWKIRRTLLNAAKGFLLRPGNPNLEAIRLLLQNTMIEAGSSDAGLAAHLTKLRANTLPTDEELKAWSPPPTEEEKKGMRVKARKLLVERGMPQALTAVMGAAASGEALGRVFDCLQIQEVARGFMFALFLQGIRAITQ